jgi:hypothetical protein
MNKLIRAAFFIACAAVVALEAIAVAGWQGWLPTRSGAARLAAAQVQAVQSVASMPAHIKEQLSQVMQAPQAPAARAEDGYYDQLRARLRWVQTRVGGEALLTPDIRSRMLLAKSAAQRAGLQEVGLRFSDVYGIINAETSWVPRLGASKSGTPNLGIAQFEPATARLLGVRDPDDPVEAVHAAAVHMKDAALWSQSRIAGLKLGADERAAKLREGVSIYYNLSSRGRAAWNGKNTNKLPRETQLHIQNARFGARQAELLEAQLRAPGYREDRAVITASASPVGG